MATGMVCVSVDGIAAVIPERRETPHSVVRWDRGDKLADHVGLIRPTIWHVRSRPESRRGLDRREVPIAADTSAAQRTSIDHLIRAGEQWGWHVQADCLCGL